MGLFFTYPCVMLPVPLRLVLSLYAILPVVDSAHASCARTCRQRSRRALASNCCDVLHTLRQPYQFGNCSATGHYVFPLPSKIYVNVIYSFKIEAINSRSSPRSLLWWIGLIAIFDLQGFLVSLALCVASGKALLDLFGKNGKQLEAEQCHQLPQPMPPRRFGS